MFERFVCYKRVKGISYSKCSKCFVCCLIDLQNFAPSEIMRLMLSAIPKILMVSFNMFTDVHSQNAPHASFKEFIPQIIGFS